LWDFNDYWDYIDYGDWIVKKEIRKNKKTGVLKTKTLKI